MTPLILGGALDANWMPLLVPLISIVAAVMGISYLFRSIRKKRMAKH